MIELLEAAYQAAQDSGEDLVIPPELEGPELEPALFALLERKRDDWGRIDDLALAIWRRLGVGALERLLDVPINYRHFDNQLGAELAAVWDQALPIVAKVVARGSKSGLALAMCEWLDEGQAGLLLDLCPRPSVKFPEAALASFCEVVEHSAHPAGPALLARLRDNRSWWVRAEATVHDLAFTTPARIAALLDDFVDKDRPGWLIAIPDEQLRDPLVQAAAVRLLARSHDVLGAQGGGTTGMHSLLHVICGASPELDAWVTTARREPGLERAIVQIVRSLFDDPALDTHLEWLSAHGASYGATQSRAWLFRRGKWQGAFFEVACRELDLKETTVALEVIDVAQALPRDHIGDVGGSTSVVGTIERCFAEPTAMGVSFSHGEVVYGARLRPLERGFTLLDAAPIDGMAELAEARRTRLAAEALMDGALGALVPAALPVQAPALLGRVVERLVAAKQVAHAINNAVAVSLKQHDALMTWKGVAQRWVWLNAFSAVQQRLYDILMEAGRFADAVIVGHEIGAWPEARALAGAERFDEALALLEHVARTPEAVAAQREWREAAREALATKALKAGDQVSHAKFGGGTVLSVEGAGATQKAKVRFASAERVLAVSFLTRA